jgi:hypothetical protein
MGLFDSLRGKDERKPLGVCIPEHKKSAKKADISHIGSIDNARVGVEFEREGGAIIERKRGKSECGFRVDGKYEVGDTLMVSGVVEFGALKKGMKAELGKVEMKVEELRSGTGKVGSLHTGQAGTVFVKAKAPPNIRYNDLLEFN